jgi:hypothetical protein
MLYAKAWKGEMTPQVPVAFSCSIDNSFAVLNLHWIDHGQAYCMSPLCKFDMSKDDHFSSFLVWIDSIGKWSLENLLPPIKTALKRLRTKEDTPPPTPRASKLTLDTALCPNDQLIKSLKTTFESIPWRFADEEYTPVSSSTASWGSPMVSDLSFTNASYPTVPSRLVGSTPTSAIQRKNFLSQLAQFPTPPPAYTQSPELVWQKRFNHAMDEIRDLQSQIQGLRADISGSNTMFQDELSKVKTNMSSLLRKETMIVRNRSISLNLQEAWPTQELTRSPLVNEIVPHFVVDKSSTPPTLGKFSLTPPSPKRSPHTFRTNPPAPPSPGMPSPGLPSPGMPSPTFSVYSETTNIVNIPPAPPAPASILKFTSVMVSGHMVSMFIPNVFLRILVLGCITDVCMLAFASPHLPSSAEYLLSFWKSR